MVGCWQIAKSKDAQSISKISLTMAFRTEGLSLMCHAVQVAHYTITSPFISHPDHQCYIRSIAEMFQAYSGGQADIIYIISNVNVVVENSLKYVFTDGHGIMAWSEFYDDLNRLNEVDWGIMNSKYWNDIIDHPDRKRKRQAEFLVYQNMPWNCLTHIAVISPHVKIKVENSLPVNGHRPQVLEQPNWYY